jgi:hypothetical protein
MLLSGGNDCCIKYWTRNKPGDSHENRFMRTAYGAGGYGVDGANNVGVVDYGSGATTAFIPGLGEGSVGLSSMSVSEIL